MADQPQTADDVKAFVEDRDIRFVRLWFTDILGQLKSFSINAAGAGRRLRGRHGLRRLVDHRLQRDRGVGHDRHAGRHRPSRCCPGAPRTRAWRACSATSSRPSREPYEGDPRHVLRRALERAEEMGFSNFYVGPELEFFYFRNAKPGRTACPRSSTRAATSTSPRSTPAPTCAARPCSRSSSSASTWSTPTTRSARPSTRSTCATPTRSKMADDCMTYRITVKEYAMKYGWHATFMPKPLFGENGSGMHTHQSLFTRRAQRLLRRQRPVLPLRRRQGVHRRPAQARARDHLGVRAVGQLLQAARARATRRRSTAPGRGATARRWCGCRSTTRARSRRRAWSCAVPTRPATPT